VLKLSILINRVYHLSFIMYYLSLIVYQILEFILGILANDFVIKIKVKATALCSRGVSRTRPSPEARFALFICLIFLEILWEFQKKGRCETRILRRISGNLRETKSVKRAFGRQITVYNSDGVLPVAFGVAHPIKSNQALSQQHQFLFRFPCFFRQ